MTVCIWRYLQRFKPAATAMALTLWVAGPVWGDDTEIFFGNFQGGGFSPNVLFIMDTSGSMGNRPSGSSEDSDKKIVIAREALKQVASEITGVNIGLMRFSNPGGPVIYPVTYIDKEISQFGDGVETVASALTSDMSDAYEITSLGRVDLKSEFLRIGVGADINSDTFYVDRKDDDATELGGDYELGEDEFEFESENDWAGIRFANVEIPRGVNISDARLEMLVGGKSDDNNGELTVEICGASLPSSPFDEDDSSTKPSNRELLTGTCQDWSLSNASGQVPSPSDSISSPNIAPIINDLISFPEWSDGSDYHDDIVLILKYKSGSDDAERVLETRDESEFASKLTIRYETGGDPANNISGLVFDRLAVPQGATVTSAYLELTPQNSVDGSQQLIISIEGSGDAQPYTGAQNEISSRLNNSGVNEAKVSVPVWQADQPTQLDITDLMQGLVGSENWCGGFPLGLLVREDGDSPEDGDLLEFGSFDGDANSVPRLVVSYDASTVGEGQTCTQASISAPVARQNDDLLFTNTEGSNSRNRNNITLQSSKPEHWAALRFANVQLPTDAVVTSAYLHLFSASAQDVSSVTLQLSIDAVADSPQFVGARAGTRTWSGNVAWSPNENWTRNTRYRSTDISSLVKIALQSGFHAGGAISIRVDLSAGEKINWRAFNHRPTRAPILEINFKSTGVETFNTARNEFITAVESLSASGMTPIQDTMFEAWRYYAGRDVVWGKYRGGHNPSGANVYAGPYDYTRVSVQDAIEPSSWGGVQRPPGCTEETLGSRDCVDSNGSGLPRGEYLLGSPKYKTPIEHECQFESHIVLLTDGAANAPHSKSLIQNALGGIACSSEVTSSQACVIELAEHMYANDMNPDLEGKQVVRTHTVGFDFDEQWLADIARAGGGVYATASDLDGLVAEFKTIIGDALKLDTSFVAPVAAINQFNRLSNLDEVYFAVFKPDNVPAWPGNLKRYQLGSADGRGNVLLDANDNVAVDPETGFFKSSARSYWSSVADGGDVEKGGAAENLPAYASRNVFTDLASAPTNLASDPNLVTVGNVTAELLGVPDDERTDLINWIRGQDVDDADGNGTVSEDRLAIGDPLHSRPVAINYGLDENEQAQVVLFFGTNAGNLHAIDATNGVELFTYIPQELLGLQADLRLNSGSSSHFYGLDGSPSAWIKNTGSSQILSAEDDHVYLYIGQRRGGQNYYALDVTDVANPRLMWKIQPSDEHFSALGYTWARPVVGRLNIEGEVKDVIYLSGGYDEANDDETTRNDSPDTMGNALYIVDAVDGSLIWSAGYGDGYTVSMPDMLHAIPAAPAVFDVDSDGFDDGFFVGDTGGQVWRFDFSQGNAAGGLAAGGVIAQLGAGGTEDASANRRFYHTPDVALADVAGVTKLVVTIGSGARPNPLSETVNDRFYAIFQDAVFGAPDAYTVLTEGDDPATTGVIEASNFYDATDNLLQSSDGATVQAEVDKLAGKNGWYMGFPRTGEKVLSTPLSFRGGVSFTTYEPRNESDSCTPKAGTSRLYLVSLTDGTVPQEQNRVTPPVVDGPPDRFTELNTPSIVDEPVIICTDQGCELFAGPEQPPIPLLEGDNIVRTHWRQD